MMRNALVKLDLDRTLKENLYGREIGEYPRIFVTVGKHAGLDREMLGYGVAGAPSKNWVNPFFVGKQVKQLDTTREGLLKNNDYVI